MEQALLRFLPAHEARSFLTACGPVVTLELEGYEGFLGYFEDEALRGVLALGPTLELRCDVPEGVRALSRFVRDELEWQQLRCPEAEGKCILESWKAQAHGAPAFHLTHIQRLHLSRPKLRVPSARDLSLQRAGREDFDELLQLMRSAATELQGIDPTIVDSSGFQADLMASIARGGEYLVRVDGKVGFSATVVEATPPGVWLENVFTAPPLRGLGLGTWSISSLCEALLREWEHVWVEVEEENERASRLYRQLSFEHIETFWLFLREDHHAP